MTFNCDRIGYNVQILSRLDEKENFKPRRLLPVTEDLKFSFSFNMGEIWTLASSGE